MKIIIILLVIIFARPRTCLAQAAGGEAGILSSTWSQPSLSLTGGAASGTATTGAEVNGAMGSGFQKTCTGSTMGAISCVYMGVSFAQMALNLLSASKSAGVAAATSDGTGSSGAANPATMMAAAGAAQKLADNAISDAASKGVILSPDLSSVTLPNGTTVPTAGLNTSQGLQAAGLTADEASQVLANAAQVAAKAKSQYSVASMGTEDGGGGGALNSRGGNGSGDDEGSSKFKSLFNAMNKSSRKPASMSGLSKQLGTTGENIGVAGDDIFQMVSRQYLRKDSQNTFLKTP